MKKLSFWFVALVLAGTIASLYVLQARHRSPIDDAKAAGKTVTDFPQTGARAFDAMDGGLPLDDGQRKGRNTWLLWTAGDQIFWGGMAQHAFGVVDLLKVVDSRLHQTRFRDMGLVNEPGMEQATQPDQFGVWLDTGSQEAGVDAAVYGRSSGIIGLRIYPNPKFDDAARRHWDANRYYDDPAYYNDPKLVRPYIVGMACSLCHVSFNPVHPPDDPEKPEWSNLSSTIGNQYLNSARVFGGLAPENSYAYQIFHSWPRGTVDTSFLATDNLNNPSRINPIFAISARLAVAEKEEIAGGALNFPGEQNQMPVPHVLKDGADSVGLVGALSRVYVSIGEFSQQWLQDHNILVGGTAQKPFNVANAQKNSVYWQATAQRIPNLTDFLATMDGPRLRDAPGGQTFISHDASLLRRGSIVFAENCAQCHSGKQPADRSSMTRAQYLDWMRAEVQKPDFLDNNFLSTEKRIPVTVVGTNAARALATNAMRGHVWDNFSSETYKALPSAGMIEAQNPFNGSIYSFAAPGGGPGYYRVPSLIGVWATAPLLHNNSIGTYNGDPSVAGRMKAFHDAMTQLLWPAKRRGQASIARTTVDSYVEMPASYLPAALQSFAQNGYLRIGPIPAGTPIDLLANADLDVFNPGTARDRMALLQKIQNDLIAIYTQHLDADAARQVLENLAPDLLRINKCPDFVLDRGHTFGTGLPDEDKRALIEFLKTF
jgi:hypothetical protein